MIGRICYNTVVQHITNSIRHASAGTLTITVSTENIMISTSYKPYEDLLLYLCKVRL